MLCKSCDDPSLALHPVSIEKKGYDHSGELRALFAGWLLMAYALAFVKPLRAIVAGAVGLLAALLLQGCSIAPVADASSTAGVATVLVPVRDAGVRDERGSFRRTFCSNLGTQALAPGSPGCDFWLRRLADEREAKSEESTATWPRPLWMPLWDIAILPGAFSDCLGDAAPVFGDAVEHLRGLGLQVEYVPLQGRATVQRNAALLRTYVLEHEQRRPQHKLLLLAYSKGAADALAALHAYADVLERVHALVSIAGMVNGSAVAEAMPELMRALVARFALPDCAPGNRDFLRGAARGARLESLAAYSRLKGVRLYSLVALPQPSRVSLLLRSQWEQLLPASVRNDGQLADHDAILPGSTLLAYLNADHLSVALPLEGRYPRLAAAVGHLFFPRAALLEAVVRQVWLDETLNPAQHTGKTP